MDVRRYMAGKKKVIDKALDRYLPCVKAEPQLIHKAIRYAVFPGGKRIRPILTIAGFEMCGGKENSIMPVACAIELIHTYTLIHDDLPCMDNDDFRRGKLSCHKKFNEGLALLAGDGILTLSFELLSEAGNSYLAGEISRAIGTCGTIGGQVVDIIKQKTNRRIQRRDLDYITSNKTGSLFEIAVRASGILKGVDDKKINALSNFGKCLGFTFQLIDDLIDKDGYVAIYGAKHTRKMAELLNERAKSYLSIFGRKAKRLSEISDLTLQRQS
ncbi:polyprenyl synthetase family protein [Candidatus Omnitrophota bacterium]